MSTERHSDTRGGSGTIAVGKHGEDIDKGKNVTIAADRGEHKAPHVDPMKKPSGKN